MEFKIIVILYVFIIKSTEKCDNINYNDLLKQLTLNELYNVLDNFEEFPSNEDFYNIWNHVLGIDKEGFDDMLTELSFYIKDYLYKYEYQRYHHIEDLEHTLNFYSLLKDGTSIDEMKHYIYSFIKYYDTLKKCFIL
ncbi:hypothetical protein PFMALIP_00389 [Plasmodium falciparum MaliPS096_E11]|uniref:Plasmodium RESA N-terminal domain-containing protein n=1 Tax=Plasmodium falciparum MaliPS096_E11 TaxID=1036727 RepID=A0A024WY44_PLAFA|nr:hypothetical protein PFMALIP_00389 [Plasmodium falciparum MaliPS096_E11]